MIMKLLLQKKIVIDVEHSFSGKFYFCFPTPPLNINLSFLHRSIQREKKIHFISIAYAYYMWMR